MARQILPIAGQIIGGMVGGPVGAAIGGAIGSVVGNAIDPQIIKGPKLGDGQVQTSAEGVYRPIVLGTGAVMGNIIHRGPEVVRKHRESQGKGSGPKVETERRYRTFAIRVAEGPIAGILRIWMDEKLVYDIRPGSDIPAESAQFSGGVRLYLGDEDQLPDPDIEAYLGIGNVNAYRGTAYIVFPNFDLTDYGDRIPQFRFEVAGKSEIEITSALAIGDINNSSNRLGTVSQDGSVWSDPPSSGAPVANYISTLGNRVVTWTVSSGGIYWSDDYVNWNGPFGPIGSSSRNRQAFTRTDTLAISSEGDAIGFTNDGENYSIVSTGLVTGPGFQNIAINDSSAVAYYVDPITGYAACGVGPPSGVGSWSAGGFIPLYAQGDHYISCSSSVFALSGRSSNLRGDPVVAYSNNNGAAWGSFTFTGSSSDRCLFVHPGNDGQWVALMQNGEVWYSSDDCQTFTQSSLMLNRTPVGITFNGLRFIASFGVPSDSGGSTIWTSDDGGVTWTERDHPLRYINRIVSAVPLMSIGGSMLLSDVVSWLHYRVGSDLFNSNDLTEPVDGIVFSGEYTAADCIRTLSPVYMFDSSEHDAGSGYRINYVKRGGPVVATVTADDLVGELEESVREDALERPQKLHIHFQSPTVGYAPAKATSMRNSPDVLVTGEVSVSVPVVFSDVDEAWQRAGVMHQVAWSEVAGTQEIVLSDAWLELVPTDTIGLVLRDQQRRLRITKVEQVEGTLKCEMMTDRQSSYTSNLTGVPLPDPTPPPPSIVGPTEFAFLDIPALTDSGDRLLYYVGVSGQSPAWHGAVIQRSMDGGANYEDVLTVRQNTIMGTLVDPVSDASEHYTDTTNVVRVELFTDDELQSLTNQQFLSEGGAFALEKPGGGWEVMQYRDADQNMDGGWELSTLLRGRLNSGADEHLAGARFVLLDGVYSVDADVGMIGQDLTHRAVSLGTSPEVAPVSTDTYTGQSQIEWPVAHILSDGVDSGSLPVQIVPRHRFGTEDHPVRSINWQGFRITATDGSNTATVDTLSDTHTFSVGGWSDPITVTASQLNRFTGAGPTVSEEFE